MLATYYSLPQSFQHIHFYWLKFMNPAKYIRNLHNLVRPLLNLTNKNKYAGTCVSLCILAIGKIYQLSHFLVQR